MNVYELQSDLPLLSFARSLPFRKFLFLNASDETHLLWSWVIITRVDDAQVTGLLDILPARIRTAALVIS
jgi:hypothetical protein